LLYSLKETKCIGLPPCVNISTEAPKQPKWSDWSLWEKCSAKCGAGVQFRRRRIEWPESKQHLQKSNICGCDVEWRPCTGHDCQELKQQSEWTDWLIKNITGDGVVEQRVRFTCKTQMGETNTVNIQSRVEERFIASKTNSWSACSTESCNGWQFKWNGDNFIKYLITYYYYILILM
jgi:semaphorin 5